jgi:hypothetical protein
MEDMQRPVVTVNEPQMRPHIDPGNRMPAKTRNIAAFYGNAVVINPEFANSRTISGL